LTARDSVSGDENSFAARGKKGADNGYSNKFSDGKDFLSKAESFDDID
jgi:hypothetical protein